VDVLGIMEPLESIWFSFFVHYIFEALAWMNKMIIICINYTLHPYDLFLLEVKIWNSEFENKIEKKNIKGNKKTIGG
jgi:hypothetical protein